MGGCLLLSVIGSRTNSCWWLCQYSGQGTSSCTVDHGSCHQCYLGKAWLVGGDGGWEGRAQCSHRDALLCIPRLTGLEESAWGDDEAAADHNYYNSIPGKEPPLGGLVDSRLAVTQPCALATLGGLGQVSLLWGQKGHGTVIGVGGKWAWDISGSSCFSCRECHLPGEMPVACLGTLAPLEQVGCSSLTESAPTPCPALHVTVPCRPCVLPCPQCSSVCNCALRPCARCLLLSSSPPMMRSWQLGIY